MQKETDKSKRPELKPRQDMSKIIRIMQTDISGDKQVYVGLTKIKGISWSFSNALCKKLNIDKKRKIEGLSIEEIKKIESFAQQPELPAYLLNRRKEYETGKNMHLITTALELKNDLDIKKLKKIRSYRGLRHALGQPSRGQRTKAHFRQKGKSVGVLKKAKVGKKS